MPPFDCGDADLNDFLFNDADAYQTERMAVTHLLEYNNNQTTEIVGYFCLLNDKLVFDLSDKEKKKWWKMFNKKNQIHFNKHRKSYPAVKIGRLAVAQSFSGKGLGRYMMYMIIGMVANITDIACRFITVDAYQDAFGFYLKNGFEFLSSEDEADKTRLMYFDLKQMSLD
jgi:predicted GNAT family N-acyltransferase